MTIDDKIRDEKLQYNINREAAKISVLASNKFNKYEYLTGEEILSFNQKQMIEQVKFTYSSLGKAFEKQIKIIEDQGENQIKIIRNQGQVKTINPLSDRFSIPRRYLFFSGYFDKNNYFLQHILQSNLNHKYYWDIIKNTCLYYHIFIFFLYLMLKIFLIHKNV